MRKFVIKRCSTRTGRVPGARAQIDTTYNGNIQAKQPDVPPMNDVKTDWRCVFNYDGGTATSTFSSNGRLQEARYPHFKFRCTGVRSLW